MFLVAARGQVGRKTCIHAPEWPHKANRLGAARSDLAECLVPPGLFQKMIRRELATREKPKGPYSGQMASSNLASHDPFDQKFN
jgi:hypothetical protein